MAAVDSNVVRGLSAASSSLRDGHFTAWLDNSRIFAVFAVVVLHVAAGFVLKNVVGSDHWWSGNIYDAAVRWCVPIFVMTSGALLLDPGKDEALSDFYRKRLSKILLPTIFWTVFFIFWGYWINTLKGNQPTVDQLLGGLLFGKPYYHMWFLYMILILYLFTPLFRKIVIQSTRHDLIFFVLAAFVIAAINAAYESFFYDRSTLFSNLFLPYIPFFFLGHLIRNDGADRSTLTLCLVFALSFVATFLGCYLLSAKIDLANGLYFYRNLSITVIPMSISVMYLLKKLNSPIFNEKVTKTLSKLTLGVYLIHPVILDLNNHKVFGEIPFGPAVSIPMTATLIFAASLMAAWAIYQVPYLRRII